TIKTINPPPAHLPFVGTPPEGLRPPSGPPVPWCPAPVLYLLPVAEPSRSAPSRATRSVSRPLGRRKPARMLPQAYVHFLAWDRRSVGIAGQRLLTLSASTHVPAVPKWLGTSWRDRRSVVRVAVADAAYNPLLVEVHSQVVGLSSRGIARH